MLFESADSEEYGCAYTENLPDYWMTKVKCIVLTVQIQALQLNNENVPQNASGPHLWQPHSEVCVSFHCFYRS